MFWIPPDILFWLLLIPAVCNLSSFSQQLDHPLMNLIGCPQVAVLWLDLVSKINQNRLILTRLLIHSRDISVKQLRRRKLRRPGLHSLNKIYRLDLAPFISIFLYVDCSKIICHSHDPVSVDDLLFFCSFPLQTSKPKPKKETNSTGAFSGVLAPPPGSAKLAPPPGAGAAPLDAFMSFSSAQPQAQVQPQPLADFFGAPQAAQPQQPQAQGSNPFGDDWGDFTSYVTNIQIFHVATMTHITLFLIPGRLLSPAETTATGPHSSKLFSLIMSFYFYLSR